MSMIRQERDDKNRGEATKSHASQTPLLNFSDSRLPRRIAQTLLRPPAKPGASLIVSYMVSLWYPSYRSVALLNCPS